MNDVLQLLHLSGRPLTARARDVVDILFVAYAVYRLLLFLRGTRALQVGQGLLLLALVYFAVERLGLVTAYTLLDRSIPSLLLVVVVIFQGDIRRALMRVGNQPFFFRWRRGEETGAVDELMEEIAELYSNDVQYELKTLSQQIEPILIVFLGVLVLVLALGVFLPVWDLGRSAMMHR